jgi:hypothetical protein
MQRKSEPRAVNYSTSQNIEDDMMSLLNCFGTQLSRKWDIHSAPQVPHTFRLIYINVYNNKNILHEKLQIDDYSSLKQWESVFAEILF